MASSGSSAGKASSGSSAGKASSGSSAGKASSGSSAGKASTGKQATRYSIYKEYGGMQNFMHSYGLKMWNDDDVQEAKAIADEMLKEDAFSKAENVSAQASAKSTTATTSKRKS